MAFVRQLDKEFLIATGNHSISTLGLRQQAKYGSAENFAQLLKMYGDVPEALEALQKASGRTEKTTQSLEKFEILAEFIMKNGRFAPETVKLTRPPANTPAPAK